MSDLIPAPDYSDDTQEHIMPAASTSNGLNIVSSALHGATA